MHWESQKEKKLHGDYLKKIRAKLANLMQGIKVQYQETWWIPNRVKPKEMHQDTNQTNQS